MLPIVCKGREPISSDTRIEKKKREREREREKVLPNVEDQTLAVRSPRIANVAQVVLHSIYVPCITVKLL